MTPFAKKRQQDFNASSQKFLHLGLCLLVSFVIISITTMGPERTVEDVYMINDLKRKLVEAEEKVQQLLLIADGQRTKGAFPDAAAYIKDFNKYVTPHYFTTFGDNGVTDNADLWELWEEQGVHVMPLHYYSPITSSKDLKHHYKKLENRELDMVGLDLNDSFQHKILTELMTTYREEVISFPEHIEGGDLSKSLTYAYANGVFDLNDASLYHTIIRHFVPARIIEVGSGHSLKVSLAAAALNDKNTGTKTEITVIEPYPSQDHNSFLLGASDISQLIVEKIQDVTLDPFLLLQAGDILFLDSSHAVGTGSDTVQEILFILPHLAPGVIIHIHDIFLPWDQPQQWVQREHRFWTEQYLLHAFLLFNSDFEVVASNAYLGNRFIDELKEKMPIRFAGGGGSFWFRRRPLFEKEGVPTVR